MGQVGKIFRVAVTGGPCGGKSSSLSFLSQKLSDYGFEVYVLKEGLTHLIEHGMRLKQAVAAQRWDEVLDYKEVILGWQLDNEKWMGRSIEIAGGKNPAVILSDRGLSDIRAYLAPGEDGDKQYRELLKQFGLDPMTARDRYSGAIHMVTPADGAEEFYTLANNEVRMETLEQARVLDKRTQEAWLGHQHLKVIDNSTDFSGKLHRALQATCRFLGIPQPLEVERKFLVTWPKALAVPHQVVRIEQMYLPEENGMEVRIRRRSQGHDAMYYLTRKRTIKPGVRIETEELISLRQFLALKANVDPTRGTIVKDRVCFLYEKQYCELDLFHNPPNLALLEVELTEEQEEVKLPDFLAIEREVTDDPAFKNHALALQTTRQ